MDWILFQRLRALEVCDAFGGRACGGWERLSVGVPLFMLRKKKGPLQKCCSAAVRFLFANRLLAGGFLGLGFLGCRFLGRDFLGRGRGLGLEPGAALGAEADVVFEIV